MPKISIIGAGSVGATTALLMALKNLGDVVLFDIVENLAQGKALDISHCTSIENFKHSVIGTNSYSDIAGSDVVVITAGFPRKENTSRTDLLMTNFDIVRSIAIQVSKYAPHAFIIVVTNPADVMTWVAKEFSGARPSKIVGMGGVLDSSRFSYYLSTTAGIYPSEKFTATVVGAHSEHMVGAKRSIHSTTDIKLSREQIKMLQWKIQDLPDKQS